MSSTLDRILVTSDFSETSDRAVRVSSELARGSGSRIFLLHVIEDVTPSPLYAHYYPTPSAEQRSTVEEQARKKLAALIAPRAGTPSAEILVVHGDPSTEICRKATDIGASLIVIASHGRTGMKRFLLGSVAERVARHATCSVLIVRPDPA